MTIKQIAEEMAINLADVYNQQKTMRDLENELFKEYDEIQSQ